MEEKKGSTIGQIADFVGGVAGRVIVAALLILIAVELSRLCYSFGRSIFYQEPMEASPGTDIVVEFTEDMGLSEAAKELETEGLLHNAEAFTIQAMLYDVHIYPGEYTLNTSMTTKEIIEEINISEEEYQARLLEAQQQESSPEEDVIGGGYEADIITPEESASMSEEELAGDTAEAETEGSVTEQQ